MQSILLQASKKHEHQFPQTVELHVAAPLQELEFDLDEALAVVVDAVRQSKNTRAMDGLGTLLAYMEILEKKQSSATGGEGWLTLTNPTTMSL